MAFVCRGDKEVVALGHSLLVTRTFEKLGGAGEAAGLLGLTNPQTVKMWMRAERRIPAKYLNRIAKLCKDRTLSQKLLDEMETWNLDD